MTNDGCDPCVICGDRFHVSDPAAFTFDNGKTICKSCFLTVYGSVSWGADRVRRIVFEYVKVQIPHGLKWKVWKRDGFKCVFCGSDENLTVDHKHPESFGGELEMENLQTLCKKCNCEKANKV